MTVLDEDLIDLKLEHQRLQDMLEVEAKPFLPAWGYAIIFTLPAIFCFLMLKQYTDFDNTYAAVIALAVMNGSINSIIAILTIRLDGHSQEALDHLDAIMGEMEKFEDTLDQANQKVTSFTGDLDEAKGIFQKVGVNLNELDLDPIAEVVEKLKENKDGLTEVLDNLREVDVTEYIRQAKGIDWKGLLDAAEEVMGFIKSKSNISDIKTIQAPQLEAFTPDDDEFWEEDEELLDDEEDFEFEEPAPTLTLAPPKRKKKLDLTPPRRR